MWICSMGTMGILHVQCELGLSQKDRKERGLFCQLNQSCWKLHEMDRFSLRNFSLFGHWGGGLFCQVPNVMFNDA